MLNSLHIRATDRFGSNHDLTATGRCQPHWQRPTRLALIRYTGLLMVELA
jgi:hypothetical protein